MASILWACASPVEPRVDVAPGGLIVEARSIERIEVLDGQGALVAGRSWPAPVDLAELDLPWARGREYTVRVHALGRKQEVVTTVPVDLPALEVRVAMPLGQEPDSTRDGDLVTGPQVEGKPVPVHLVLAAHEAGDLSVRVGDRLVLQEGAVPAGSTRPVTFEVDGPTEVLAQLGEHEHRIELRPAPLSNPQVEGIVRIVRVALPVDPQGSPEAGRPRDRIVLPAPWWDALLRRTRLGFRQRDPWFPWTHQAVTVRNDGPSALTVVVRARVLDPEGQPVAALRPRMRDNASRGGFVSALVRVPAQGEAIAVLPVYVDTEELPWSTARLEREVDVVVLGLDTPADAKRVPLVVASARGLGSAAFASSALAAVAGWGLLASRSRAWMAAHRSSDLMVVSLFASLLFAVGAAGRVIAAPFTALLGPFAAFVTAGIDDVFRYALLTALLLMSPRVGTAALCIFTSWVLGGFALGSFTATDPLYVGARIVWLEGALFAFGATRGRASPLRLALGFGLANALSAGTQLSLGMTLYRLHYADWYVAATVLGPGFLYVFAATLVTARFARGLTRVAS